MVNYNFINWYKSIKEQGYEEILDLNDIDDLINTLTKWYEFKYSDRVLNRIYDSYNSNNNDLCQHMSFNQLLSYLTLEEISLMKGKYRGRGLGVVSIYQKEKISSDNLAFTLNIYSKSGDIKLSNIVVNSTTGIVYDDFILEDYIGKMTIKVDELYELLKREYGEELDCFELKKCIFNHECDLVLLKKVIQMVANNLLSSSKSNSQTKRLRVRKMYDELQKELHTDLLDGRVIDKEVFEPKKEVDEEISMMEKLEVKRMNSLEKYFEGIIEIDDLNAIDINYLSMAELMPYKEIVQDIEFFNKYRFCFDGVTFIQKLMKKYNVSEKVMRKRLIDVIAIQKYQKKVYSELNREQKRMVKKLNKTGI